LASGRPQEERARMARTKAQAASSAVGGKRKKPDTPPESKDPHEMVCDIMTNIADCVMENMVLLVDFLPEMFYKNSAGAKAKKKAAKKDGDPKKKRGLTGYLLFGKEVRINLKEEGSTIAPKEVMAEIAKRWKLLTPSQKESYQERAGSHTDEQPLALPAPVPVAVEAPAAKKQKKKAEAPAPAPAPALAAAVVAPAAEESEEDKAKREKMEKKQRKKEKKEKKRREEAEAAAAAAK